MSFSESISLLNISANGKLENTFEARLLCVKNFLKKTLTLPFTLIFKLSKTLFRCLGAVFASFLLLMSLANSAMLREFFVERVHALTKDLIDWVFLPFALIIRFFKFMAALFIHPKLYFND
jgi:hypothetical protein